MTLLTEYAELDEISPGQFRHVQSLKNIAYRESGSLLPIIQDWEDSGIPERPHKVDRAPIMVSMGEDGMRRMHPTRELDRYVELGAPFVKTGGVWGQVDLGAPTRTNNRLQWTKPQANMYADFGGHFVKLSILLKGGFVPEDSQIAFPVGMTGFTRNGSSLLRDGVVIAQLQKPLMLDFVNPTDTRPITGQFVNLAGQPYWLMTLPSLTGMVQPVIDPTVTLQPDATAGLDAAIISDGANATTNYGTLTTIHIGEEGTTVSKRRTLIKFDVSSIPAAAQLSSAILTLKLTGKSATANGTLTAYRQKRAWVEAQCTWSIYATATAWGTNGGFGSGDCEQTDIGTLLMLTTATNGNFFDLTLTADKVQDWVEGAFTNNGMLIRTAAELNDEFYFVSSDSATGADRPKLTVIYTIPVGQRVLRGVGRGVMRGAR